MKRVLSGVVLAMIAGCALALAATSVFGEIVVGPPAPAKDLSGLYLVHGTAPEGVDYDGICVVRREGESYVVQHATAAEDLGIYLPGQSLGRGVFRDGRFAVAGAIGLTIYRVDGAKLVGEYFPLHGGPLGREELMFIRTLPRKS
jgi:hypothetical protein